MRNFKFNNKQLGNLIISSTLLVLSLQGCVGVKISTIPDSNSIKCYTPKPFLLITKIVRSDSAIHDAKIIYLPDLMKPIFIKPKPTIGKNNLKLDFENGVLKSFGVETDTKFTESISSLFSEVIKSDKLFGTQSIKSFVPGLYELSISDNVFKLKKVIFE